MADIFSLVLILNAISGATSLTVTVRRVQNPNYYRYSPEVYVTKLATTPSPQERLHIVRIPKYRRKYRYRAKPVVYPMVTQRTRPPKKYHESRPVTAIVSNEVDEAKEDYPQEVDFQPVSFDEGVSFPSFGKESPYQSIRKPEDWTTHPPVEGAEPTFTPVQMYMQIRQTNKVKHVPQSEALKDATTLEEVVNAPRLKELLRTTRVREVYSEEGYEDAGYDHGGHIRHAEHDEGFAAKDEGLFKLKESIRDEDYAMPQATRPKPKKAKPKKGAKSRYRVPEEELAQESKVEPKITRTRSEVTSVEFATLPPKYKGEHKYSSKIRSGNGDRKHTTEATGYWPIPTIFESFPSPTSPMRFDVFTLPVNGTEGTTQRSKYIKIVPTSEEPGKSANATTSDGKRSRSKSFKYSRLHAKYPKRDRFRLAKLNHATPETVQDDKRIIVPTIGYINSLTTAHFGKNQTNPVNNNNHLTTPLNLTQALNYLRSNKQQPVKRKIAGDVKNFEAKKLKNRIRRTVDEEEEGEEEEHEEDIPDDGEEVHDEKNAEIEDEERQRLEDVNEDREEYEKRLREELDEEEEKILNATIGRYQPEDEVLESLKNAYGETPDDDDEADEAYQVTTTKPIDRSKYPFYFSRKVFADSALRYATNPKNFPMKKGNGMAFYESREKLVQCPEVRPDLSDIPKRNATLETEENRSRLEGLGDKILCLRSKYFDEDPLDNPLFKEKEIDYVGRVKYNNKENLRNGRDSYHALMSKQNQVQSSAPPEKLLYHSTYQYQPNRTLHIMVKKRQEEGMKERIIPVTEKIDDIPLQIPGYKMAAPIRRKYTRLTYRPIVPSTPPPTHARTKLIVPHNCIHVIAKMAALNGHKNLIIDCNDATLFQELRDDVRFLKIVPKTPEESPDWTPMIPYQRFGRRADRNDHYLITELREEADFRRGEVVEEDAKRTARKKRETVKRPANPLRLSLKEFFQRLQTGRSHYSPKPFQLPAAESVEDEEVVKIGGQYIKGTNGRELIYIRLGASDPGKWIVRKAPPETEKNARKPQKSYKKYGKGKL